MNGQVPQTRLDELENWIWMLFSRIAGVVPPATTPEIVERFDFTYATPSPTTLFAMLPGDTLESVKVLNTTPFSDPASTISIGTTATPGLVFAPGQAVVTAPGAGETFDDESLHLITTPTNLVLTIAPGASVAGAGTILFKIKRP